MLAQKKGQCFADEIPTLKDQRSMSLAKARLLFSRKSLGLLVIFSALSFFAACGRGEPEFSGSSGSRPNPGGGGQPPSEGPSWHWENPLPQGNNLYGIWVIPGTTDAKDQVFSVGGASTLLIGNESRWNLPLVENQAPVDLLAVSGQTSSGEILAVGRYNRAMIRINDQWRALAPSIGIGLETLWGVWASPNPDEFFVVGDDGRIYNVTGQGTRWNREGMGLATKPLYSVWGRGSGPTLEVFAVGVDGVILHRDAAGTWTKENSPVSVELFGVAGQTAQNGDVHAVGAKGTILRREGGVWKEKTINAYKNFDLRGVWQEGTDTFAVGSVNKVVGMSATKAIILHRDTVKGMAGNDFWLDESNPNIQETLRAVYVAPHAGESNVTVYAVGMFGTVLKREQGTFIPLSSRLTIENLRTVWAGNENEVYAGGENGTLLKRQVSGTNISWKPEIIQGITPNNSEGLNLNAISGSLQDPTLSVYAVGDDGVIIHRQPNEWRYEAAGLTSGFLSAVWVGTPATLNNRSVDNVFVVGEGGRSCFKSIYNPTQNPDSPSAFWALGNITLPDINGNPTIVNKNLNAVFGAVGQQTNPGYPLMYIGGVQDAQGQTLLIQRNNAAQYKREISGSFSQPIKALLGFQDLSEIHAVGDAGGVLSLVNGNWQRSIEAEAVLRKASVTEVVGGSSAATSNNLFILAVPNVIIHRKNGTWSEEPVKLSTYSNQKFTAISAVNGKNIYLVGEHGLILHYY